VRGKSIERITLADKHYLFRRGLKTLLVAEHDINRVDEVATLAEACDHVRSLGGILVLDVALLEGASDADFIEVRQLQQGTPTLFIGASDEPACVNLATRAGGRAYVCKSLKPNELLSAIRRVAGSLRPDDGDGARAAADLQALAQSSSKYASAMPLTIREKEIVKLLAEGRTVRESANELGLSVKTVEAHKLNLMRKLNIHNRATLIDYAVEKGFIEPVLVG